MTFEERCRLSEQCLPNSTYRNKLTALHNEMLKALAQPEQEPVAWRDAAIRLGEELSSVGPDGYYNMSARQWLDWSMEQKPRGKNSLPPQRKEDK